MGVGISVLLPTFEGLNQPGGGLHYRLGGIIGGIEKVDPGDGIDFIGLY